MHGFLLGVWVIDDKKVSTLTCNGSAYTDSEVISALVGVPATSGFGVGGQFGRKDSLIVWRIDQVPDFATKSHGKFCCVGCLNNFFLRKSSQEPSGEKIGRKLRLGVSGRHIDDESL